MRTAPTTDSLLNALDDISRSVGSLVTAIDHKNALLLRAAAELEAHLRSYETGDAAEIAKACRDEASK